MRWVPNEEHPTRNRFGYLKLSGILKIASNSFRRVSLGGDNITMGLANLHDAFLQASLQKKYLDNTDKSGIKGRVSRLILKEASAMTVLLISEKSGILDVLENVFPPAYSLNSQIQRFPHLGEYGLFQAPYIFHREEVPNETIFSFPGPDISLGSNPGPTDHRL